MGVPAATDGRRTLRFSDFSELIAEASHVASTPCQTLGQWNVGQILDHLVKFANAPFDGYGNLKAPWYVRYLIVPFIKNSLLIKPMAPGRQLPQNATCLIPDPNADPVERVEALKQALARYSTEDPVYPQPALGYLALQEWVALNLRHAELHLSFIVPLKTQVVQPAN